MSTATIEPATMGELTVRPLEEADLPAADRVFRLAFGTIRGLPEPLRFAEGTELVRSRFRADPSAAFVAEIDGELVASAYAVNWGSFAVFGPLTVHPDYWDRGIGKRLWEVRLPLLERWGVRQAGLFTQPQSTKHVHLYQRFDFWPRFLTAVTAKTIERAGSPRAGWSSYAELPKTDRDASLDRCRALTDAIDPGLDLSREIRALEAQGLGETILLGVDERLDGFAICHLGEGSEAGPGSCYVKFGAVRPGADAAARFERLLDACEELAVSRDLPRLVAGVNLARHEAYRIMLARGQRPFIQGVAMHRPNEPGFCRPDVYVIDDWR